jgi:hypothetical protein
LGQFRSARDHDRNAGRIFAHQLRIEFITGSIRQFVVQDGQIKGLFGKLSARGRDRVANEWLAAFLSHDVRQHPGKTNVVVHHETGERSD